MRPRNLLRLVWILALSVAGCAPALQRAAIRPAVHTALAAPQANFTQDQLARIEQNCPFGRPRLDPSFGFGPTRFVIRRGYVLEHSSLDKIPLWVCEGVSKDQLEGSEARTNPFQADPELPAGERAELRDYKNSGYDRGHQAPAGDQTTNLELKRETFYLSNMAPQIPKLNQQI